MSGFMDIFITITRPQGVKLDVYIAINSVNHVPLLCCLYGRLFSLSIKVVTYIWYEREAVYHMTDVHGYVSYNHTPFITRLVYST